MHHYTLAGGLQLHFTSEPKAKDAFVQEQMEKIESSVIDTLESQSL